MWNGGTNLLKHYSWENGKLVFGDCLVSSIGNKYKTPLYVYDTIIIDRKINDLKETITENIELYYAMKANPNLGIVSIMAKKKMGVEVSSSGEICIAIKAGFEPVNILFTGAGKTEEEIRYALENGISFFNVESYNQAKMLEKLAREADKKIKVLIRINPNIELGQSSLKMGGTARQFGIDEENIEPVLEYIQQSSFCRFVGIHLHVASEVLDTEIYKKNIRNVLNTAVKLSQAYKLEFEIIDLGGGLGVPYIPRDGEGINLHELKQFFEHELKQYYDITGQATKFIIEPGRFIVAECGMFLTKIIDIKDSRGKRYVITDGGVNNRPGVSIKSRLSKQHIPIEIVDKIRGNTLQTVEIAGPLMTPTDILATGVNIATEVEVGDLVAFFMSGAYAFSTSSQYFLSHPVPAEVLIHKGKAYCVRQRGTEQKFLDGQYTLEESPE